MYIRLGKCIQSYMELYIYICTHSHKFGSDVFVQNCIGSEILPSLLEINLVLFDHTNSMKPLGHRQWIFLLTVKAVAWASYLCQFTHAFQMPWMPALAMVEMQWKTQCGKFTDFIASSKRPALCPGRHTTSPLKVAHWNYSLGKLLRWRAVQVLNS